MPFKNDIEFFEQSPVRFEVGDYKIYGTDVCEHEIAPPFCQPVKSTDTTPFQIRACEFDQTNLILNGGFSTGFDWTLGTGWTIDTSGNSLNHTGNAGIASQDVGITSGKTYQLRFSIQSWDDNASGNDMRVKIGGTTVETINDLTSPTPNKVYLVTQYIASASNSLIEFDADDNIDVDVTISALQALDEVTLLEADCQISQLVTNPEFPDLTGWSNPSTNWSVTSQQSGILKGVSGVLSQSLSVAAGNYLRIEYDLAVDETSTGDCVVKIGGNVVTTIDKDTTEGVTTHYFYVKSLLGTTDLEFVASLMGLTLSYVKVDQLCGTTLTIRDANQSPVIAQAQDESFFTKSDSTSVVQIDASWSGLDNDCYDICIQRADETSNYGAEKIGNTDFSNGSWWGFSGTDWQWGGAGDQRALHISGGAGSFVLDPISNMTLVANTVYLVKFTVEDWDDNGSGDAMTVALGGTTIATLADVLTNEGDYEILISLSAITTNKIEFTATTNIDVALDDVSVKAVAGDDATDVACSECFELGTWVSGTCDRTLLMTATNNENAFGQDYENFTYTQRMRVFGRLKEESYPNVENDIFLSLPGVTSINFFQNKELKTLKLSHHPQYVHNALSVMMGHDTWSIDGNSYKNDSDGYSPSWVEPRLLATSTTPVFKSDQTNRGNDSN